MSRIVFASVRAAVLVRLIACASPTTESTRTSADAIVCSSVTPDAPETLPGQQPLRRSFSGKHGTEQFDCYGACGASCKLEEGGNVTELAYCMEWRDCQTDTLVHQQLTYEIVAGATHPFCSWHDTCYLECAMEYGSGRTNLSYQACTACCDMACIQPETMAGNFAEPPGSLSPLRLTPEGQCGRAYGEVIRRAGRLPTPRTWRLAMCGALATTAVGSNAIADAFGEPQGRIELSSLKTRGDISDGACNGNRVQPVMPDGGDF